MAYRWNLEGPSFEFPTPYNTENRLLVLRGYALIALAVVVALVLALVGAGDAARPVVTLEKLPEPASVWPHVIGLLLMAVLGVLNLVQASRQQTLQLAPGQPASLMPEVAHEATGASPGAPWLIQALGRGMAAAQGLHGPYAAWLRWLGSDLAAAPTTLHDYLRVRLARLALFGGLVLLLALGALAGTVLAQPAALPLVSVVVGAAGVAALGRHLLFPVQAAPGPWAITAMLAAALAVAMPLAWFADTLPGATRWPRLGLPLAASVMLALGLAFEVLGLLSARAQALPSRPTRITTEETSLSFDADMGRLFAEIDRELHRRWAEGIPNRRYARQPPVLDAAADEGSFSATVLEESQPLIPRGAASTLAPAQSRWLLVLGALGLCSSVVGGGLWVWLARAHMLDSAASWVPAAVGLVCLLAGGYAFRISHVLWSRLEVESTLTWLEFKGSYFRVPGAALAAEPAARMPGAAAVGVEELTLKACVVQARSVFYAAATYEIGSRALLTLTPDAKTAANWTELAHGFARSVALSAMAQSPALLAARARARERRAGDAGAVIAPKRPPRFCSACGTPLLVGARFCQQCGNTLGVD